MPDVAGSVARHSEGGAAMTGRPSPLEQPGRIACVVKLRPTCAQQAKFRRWLFHLTGVYNWTVKTIQWEAEAGRYPSVYDLKARLNGHSKRLGIPIVVLRGTVMTAHDAWDRCFKKLGRKPKLKGRRRPLNSILFAGANLEYRPKGGRIWLPQIGAVRIHRQEIPEGRVSSVRLLRRASGWYLYLFVKAQPEPIDRVSLNEIGIDPGYASLLTFSTGEKIPKADELERSQIRLAQAQRGNRKALTARLHERIRNQRLNRNHHLSRRLVAENALIAFSKDRVKGLAKSFGKAVTSAAHAQLRAQLRYKSLAGGSEYVEVEPKNSTRTCSNCGALSGPHGWAQLEVRLWVCVRCGAIHDRDQNAAINALIAGRGVRLERGREAASGIAI